MAALRWGIAGCGKISNDFAAALFALGTAEHKMIAAAARDVKKAAEFATKFSIPKHYGAYEDLYHDKEIDIIYVGTMNSTHYGICKAALQNNKHVLCEKSLTLLQKHTEELVRLSKEKKQFFQEAVWTRFFPSMKKLREDVKTGVIGDVKLASAVFGFTAGDTGVHLEKKLGGGSMPWIGVYPLQLALAVYGPEMPEKIFAAGAVSPHGVDTGVSLLLQYKNGGIAQLSTSFLVNLPNEVHIYGTKGEITVPTPFHAPIKMTVNGQEETFPLPAATFPAGHVEAYTNATGMIYQAQEVRNCINKGLLESPFMTHQESITIAAIMEEAFKQIGVTFADVY